MVRITFMHPVSAAVLAVAIMAGCAALGPKPTDRMSRLLTERGMAERDASDLAGGLGGVSFPGRIALAALSKPSADALTRPEPGALSCVLATDTASGSGWQKQVDEMKSRGVLDQALPLNEAERKEALALLASGEFVGDVADTLDAVFRIDPALADEILRDLLHRRDSGLDLLTPLRSDAKGSAACANQYLSHVKAGDIKKPSEVCRPPVLTQTLKTLYSTPGGAAVSDTVRVLIRKDNRTMRLALIAYARTNGINISEANLDQLEQALDRDNPDFYPLLAGAVESLAQQYGVTELSAKLREVRQRDQACRSRATPIASRRQQLSLTLNDRALTMSIERRNRRPSNPVGCEVRYRSLRAG